MAGAGILCFRHQIDAAFVPWVTAPDTADGQPATFQCTMLFNGFLGIVGTGRVEAAVTAQHGADEKLIATDNEN